MGDGGGEEEEEEEAAPNMEEKPGDEEVRPTGTNDRTGESGELLPVEELGDCGRM